MVARFKNKKINAPPSRRLTGFKTTKKPVVKSVTPKIILNF